MEEAKPSCDILLFVATDDEEAELRAAAAAMGLTSNVIQARSGIEYIDLGSDILTSGGLPARFPQ